MRIYIADENETLMLKYVTEEFSEIYPDAEITSFNRPDKLLYAAAKQMCDLAVLDIFMPGMDGIRLAKKLREIDGNVSIIFCTAEWENIDTRTVPFAQLIHKPVIQEEIYTAVKAIEANKSKAATHGDLFKDIAKHIGCSYISDIRSQLYINLAFKIAVKLDPNDYNFQQWNDLAYYLCNITKEFFRSEEIIDFFTAQIKD